MKKIVTFKAEKRQKLNLNLKAKTLEIFTEAIKQNPKMKYDESYVSIRTLASLILDVAEKDLTWTSWDRDMPLLSTLNSMIDNKQIEGLKPSETSGHNCKIFRLTKFDFERIQKKVLKVS